MEEIEDRRRFLEQMESLGKGKQYRAEISTEISQVRSIFDLSTCVQFLTSKKIRMLEVIDRDRCGKLHELEAALKKQASQ
jgi:hypothetical protein